MTTPHEPVRRAPAGVGLAIASALLFGLSTPCAKVLVGEAVPLLLAGLLYAGSGLGLCVIRLLLPVSAGEAPVSRADVPWLGGAIVAGGILGPVLLMTGLRSTPASAASLLLNLEGVFTALLAWFVFRENFDRRIAVGFALIVAGGVALSWDGGAGGRFALPLGSLAITAACFCWAVDNNLTQRVSGADPLVLAAIKGGVAGGVNLGLAVATGADWPSAVVTLGALAVGFLGYGVSLVLFVLALRHLGTARTGAYFSVAPFFGAAVSLVALRDSIDAGFVAAGVLMAAGVWLHLTERHEHGHHHEPLQHSHRHVHDQHHGHSHGENVAAGESHTHPHVHEAATHLHPHYPDIHHRHGHS
jgi:drug/metabolite transporter (DMT)-like permease